MGASKSPNLGLEIGFQVRRDRTEATRAEGRALGPRGSRAAGRYLKPGPMPLPAPLCAPAGAAQEERSARLQRSASRRGNTCSRQPGRHASSRTRLSSLAAGHRF
ncbi:Hypothetical predicted protein [Marmota monax]|uniref:Uncharacterized protein n=1 Tax=Marmota monax TaxID=9995 RepID=A0A5E4CV82_MARMO|nr:Hypothetical predicted protein [Marmota monax]